MKVKTKCLSVMIHWQKNGQVIVEQVEKPANDQEEGMKVAEIDDNNKKSE